MSDFRALAEKTVVELFDMVKEKVAEIEKLKSENDDLQKRIDTAVHELQWQNWKQWDIVRDKAIKILRGEHE